MPNITQYDATSPAGIPLDPASVNTREKAIAAHVAVAAYMDREFEPDLRECEAKYPELAKLGRVCGIASTFSSVAKWIDYEPGNPCYGDPEGVAKWVLEMLSPSRDIFMPGAYADRSDMPALQKAFVKLHVPRSQTTLWLAAPGVNPQPFLDAGFDLVQDKFADAFDVTAAKPHVYMPVGTPSPPKPKPKHAAALTFHGHHGGAHVTFKGGHWRVDPDHDGEWSIKAAPKGKS